jgi:glycine cleavage system aminomethyltransferase T
MPGAAVFAAGKPVGRITSCAFSPAIKRVIAFADIAAAAYGKPMEVAAPPPGEGRVAANFRENPEKMLEDDFFKAEKKATDSRRSPV